MKVSKKKQRIVSVCLPCKSLKVRCDKLKPVCSRCKRVGKNCSYGEIHQIITPPKTQHDSDYNSAVNDENGSTNDIDKDIILNGITQPSTFDSLVSIATSQPYSDISGCPMEFNDQDFKGIVLNVPPNIQINISDPNERIVTYGSTTYLDLPLGSHGIIQYDPFARTLCIMLHGSTIFDLQSRLNNISIEARMELKKMGKLNPDNNDPVKDIPTDLPLKVKDDKILLRPLVFIEKAIMNWVERANEYVKNQLPLDYFNTMYTIEDTMHSSLLSTLQNIVNEVETILCDKDEVNFYLTYFYENVYPIHPFIEISIFEKSLDDILIDRPDLEKFKLNVLNERIRIKLQTLSLLLLILAITLRVRSIENDALSADELNIIKNSSQMILLAQKILSLLNGFKFTNENILASMLYLFIAEHLHASNRFIYVAHEEVLTLNCLNSLSETLGLFHDPNEFLRYSLNDNFTQAENHFKSKLWIGLQMLRLQICTVDGDINKINSSRQRNFINNNLKSKKKRPFNGQFDDATKMDIKIMNIHEKVYHFHMLLGSLMESFTNQEYTPTNLQVICENIQKVCKLMDSEFSLSHLSTKSNKTKSREKTWRNAYINIEKAKNYQIINVNIIGLASIMSIYTTIAIFFEKESLKDPVNSQTYYQKFMMISLKTYLKLLGIIVKYLTGGYDDYLPSQFNYFLNKTVIFTIIKLFRTQMTYTLRFSYFIDFRTEYLNDLKKNNTPDEDLTNAAFDDPFIQELDHAIMSIKDQMKLLADLTEVSLKNPYFGAYQAAQMVRYFIYLLSNGYLTIAVNEFWNSLHANSGIPERIVEKLNSKWGVGPKTDNVLKNYMMNPIILNNMTPSFIQEFDRQLNNHSLFNTREASVTPALEQPDNFDLLGDQNDLLNQFLQSNFEFFQNVIDQNMGELPEL